METKYYCKDCEWVFPKPGKFHSKVGDCWEQCCPNCRSENFFSLNPMDYVEVDINSGVE